MQALLDDLMDFNRTKLGLGIRVAPSDLDLAQSVIDEVEQFRATQAQRQINLTVSGDCRGCWDGRRLQQVLRNLLGNALKYGDADVPVRVTLLGEDAGVRLEVTNTGPPLDTAQTAELFDPLRRGAAGQHGAPMDSLGLGLFIVREIMRAHGGEVGVCCDSGEVTFAVYLPRRDAGAAT